MDDDIVERLRVIHCAADDLTSCGTCLPCQAAAEIERLRLAGNNLVKAIRNHDLREEHLQAWEEARRG